MSSAEARHILVETEVFCQQLKDDLATGKAFEDVAKEHSQCPSKSNGGALGSFGPGQMVPEFDSVVFNEAVNVVHGPIKTQFGWHLVEITSRSD
jgi:peptidyl-prolyl cis-trans isomerase C